MVIPHQKLETGPQRLPPAEERSFAKQLSDKGQAAKVIYSHPENVTRWFCRIAATCRAARARLAGIV